MGKLMPVPKTMDYPPDFFIKYVVIAIEEYYGVKIRLDKKLHPHFPSNCTPEQLDKMEGFIKGFVEGLSFL